MLFCYIAGSSGSPRPGPGAATPADRRSGPAGRSGAAAGAARLGRGRPPAGGGARGLRAPRSAVCVRDLALFIVQWRF